MDDPRHLIEQSMAGDTAAMQSLLVRHLPSLEAYLRLQAGPLLRSKETPEDLLQSICAEVLQGLDGFEYRGEAAFRHWLFKRALHKVLNKSRHHRAGKRDAGRERPLDAPSEHRSASVLDCYKSICTPSRIAVGREAVERFEAAFDELEEDYREAITLYRIVGMGYPDIAAQMGRSEGAVRNLVYRGLARLSFALGD